MIKVLMHGCNGKMGQVVSRMVDETEGMELAAGVDRFLGRENSGSAESVSGVFIDGSV